MCGRNTYIFALGIWSTGSAENEDGESPTPRYRPDGIDALCKATGITSAAEILQYQKYIYIKDSHVISFRIQPQGASADVPQFQAGNEPETCECGHFGWITSFPRHSPIWPSTSSLSPSFRFCFVFTKMVSRSMETGHEPLRETQALYSPPLAGR